MIVCVCVCVGVSVFITVCVHGGVSSWSGGCVSVC